MDLASLQHGRAMNSARFVIAFLVLALAGIGILQVSWVDDYLVTPFTELLVRICAVLISIFGGEVQTNGTVLSFRRGGVGVSVENGCNAVEVCMLLAAAVLAWPSPIKQKLFGLLACVGLVQTVNLFRIISLLFILRSAPSVFEFFHLYVWEVMILLEAVVIFFVWVGRGQPPAPSEPSSDP
ncbi:MAG: exosortase H [Hyphomonas sp.]|nr:exosortase H [Hyphomonas sp.]